MLIEVLLDNIVTYSRAREYMGVYLTWQSVLPRGQETLHTHVNRKPIRPVPVTIFIDGDQGGRWDHSHGDNLTYLLPLAPPPPTFPQT